MAIQADEYGKRRLGTFRRKRVLLGQVRTRHWWQQTALEETQGKTRNMGSLYCLLGCEVSFPNQ